MTILNQMVALTNYSGQTGTVVNDLIRRNVVIYGEKNGRLLTQDTEVVYDAVYDHLKPYTESVTVDL